MKLTRRVTFAAGHRYWIDGQSEAENRATFGPYANRFNHGHNYILDVTCAGDIHPDTGMVVNIKDIDLVLKQNIVEIYDQRSINDEILLREVASTENIAHDIWRRLHSGSLPAQLIGLRLEEMPRLWVELQLTESKLMTTLTRTYEFAAAHRLYAEAMTPNENWALFNKCSYPNFHGHNYILEVTVTGQPDATTGFICDLTLLDEAVERLVINRYDHRNLNEDIEELSGKITTSENVVMAIWGVLDGQLPAQLHRLRLHETARNIFEVGR